MNTVLSAVAGAQSSASLLPLVGSGGFLELAILFIVLAVVAAVLGARGVAGVSATIAKWLVIAFLVLAVLAFLL